MNYSIVIPVFNEEGNIEILTKEIVSVFEQISDDYEIIFIDDGSKDGSFAVIKGLKSQYPMVRCISFEKNSGQSAALEAGFRKSRGEIIITMDADLQNDPKDIPLLLSEIDHYDLVVGWRASRKDPLKQKDHFKIRKFFQEHFSRRKNSRYRLFFEGI